MVVEQQAGLTATDDVGGVLRGEGVEGFFFAAEDERGRW
jgi:hypothetical protein